MPKDGQTAPDLGLRPTEETYQAFQHAYDHFNWILFETALPGCLITFQRKSRSKGYFAGGRFIRGDETRCDEIAMNPTFFRSRTLEQTLSTLAHEMVHLWQHHYGEPGRGRYHNRQWAEKMKSIGLHPSDTGDVGGTEIGDRMTHYIVDDGPFAAAAAELIATGFAITWKDAPPEAVEVEVTAAVAGSRQTSPIVNSQSKSGKRVKYTCPACGLNAWSRHEAQLICGADQLPMTPTS